MTPTPCRRVTLSKEPRLTVETEITADIRARRTVRCHIGRAGGATPHEASSVPAMTEIQLMEGEEAGAGLDHTTMMLTARVAGLTTTKQIANTTQVPVAIRI
jgi:hypothetical protein